MIRPETIAVAIVEDQARVRSALELVIDGAHGMTCVGAFESAELLIGSNLARLDVVLLDLELPGMYGTEAIGPIRARWSRANVVVLTVHQEEDTVFDALCAGAVGYMLKTTSPATVVEAVREVHEGGAPMTPSIARRVMGFMRRGRNAVEALTNRETEVLDRLVQGKSNKQIAAELFVSPNTVAYHIKQIYHKMHVHNRAEAVARAMRSRRP